MIISNNIQLKELSIYVPKLKTLILSDIHIGYEEALNKQGILVPRVYFKKLYEKTKQLIVDLDIHQVIINGDLKHEFGKISETEWRHTLQFLDLFKKQEIIIIQGNHDTIIEPITKKRNVKVVPYYIIDNIMVAHGDVEIDLSKEKKEIETIIIGHEHPAITIQNNNRSETYKCFLIGKTKDKKHTLIAMPSYNEITQGTNILNESLLSPYLKQPLDEFQVIIQGDTLYDFGSVKEIKKKFSN